MGNKKMKNKILLKQEVIDVIDGKKSPRRVPSTFLIWPPLPNKNIFRQIKVLLKNRSDIKLYYPACYIKPLLKGCINLGFDTSVKKTEAKDANIKIADYDQLDNFLAKSAQPEKLFCHPVPKSRYYKLGILWNCIFETFWQVRGMTNTLMDFYLNPAGIHKAFRGITDFYKAMVVKYKKRGKCDGILITDDLGTQTSTFFSNEIFREFFLPYYKEIADVAHENGMHLWFHSCGCVTNFIPMFIEAGIDVLHPIQKYAMNEIEVFEKYKDKITFLYGFDVQQTIPFGSPCDVKNEVHRVFDLFSQAKGRFIFTSGNTVEKNCPIESYEMLVNEARKYNPYKK